MMKKINILFVIFIALGVYSCQDIFEDDITDIEINLLAPADGLNSESFNHTFWWDPVDGATGYEFQIVSLHFHNEIYTHGDQLP